MSIHKLSPKGMWKWLNKGMGWLVPAADSIV